MFHKTLSSSRGLMIFFISLAILGFTSTGYTSGESDLFVNVQPNVLIIFDNREWGCRVLRELHVYGSLVPVGKDADTEEWQHRNYGRVLLARAEEIARDGGYAHLAIMSGIGSGPYYRRQGYERKGPYMVKGLSWNPGTTEFPRQGLPDIITGRSSSRPLP